MGWGCGSRWFPARFAKPQGRGRMRQPGVGHSRGDRTRFFWGDGEGSRIGLESMGKLERRVRLAGVVPGSSSRSTGVLAGDINHVGHVAAQAAGGSAATGHDWRGRPVHVRVQLHPLPVSFTRPSLRRPPVSFLGVLLALPLHPPPACPRPQLDRLGQCGSVSHGRDPASLWSWYCGAPAM